MECLDLSVPKFRFLLAGVFFSWGRIYGWSLARIIQWSVQQSAPRMALEISTSFLSVRQTMMSSRRCQCLERGCCQEVLNLSLSWNKVLVMTSWFSEQSVSRRRPLSLTLPTPCWPRAPFHSPLSEPTLALKSSRRMSLSVADVLSLAEFRVA